MGSRQLGRTVLGLFLAWIACTGERDGVLLQLQSGRPEERAAAVKRLGEGGRAMDLPLIRHAAVDPAPIVRAEAATALADRREASSADLLAQLLEDPDEGVQVKAAVGLAQLGGEKSRATLALRYVRAGQSTRIAIVKALRDAGAARAMEQMVSAESTALWARYQKMLESGSPAERAAAAQEVGRSGRPEAVSQLLALTARAPGLIAVASARALGEAGDPTAAGALAKLLSSNEPELKTAAGEALGRLGELDFAPLLEAVAIEASSASRFATAALMALPRAPTVDERLCHVAARAAAPEAVAAAREMRSRGGCPLGPILQPLSAAFVRPAKRSGSAARGTSAGPRGIELSLEVVAALGTTAQSAQPRLGALLKHPDPLVRRAALRAAAELRGSTLAPEVTEVYQEQLARLQGLRAKWVSALPPGGTVTPPAGVPELAEDAPQEDILFFADALLALGMVGAPQALAAAEAFTADPSPAVRAAADAAAAYAGERGLALAGQGLWDSDPSVRSSAAVALVEQGQPGVTAVLAHLDIKRGGALELLAALSRAPLSESAADKLTPLLDSTAAEGALAAALLGKCRAKSGAAALMRYLDQAGAFGRRQALEALGDIGEARSADAIARSLYDESPAVRAAAAEALGRVGGTSHLAELAALKGDYYASVRRAAQAALEKLHSVSEVR